LNHFQIVDIHFDVLVIGLSLLFVLGNKSGVVYEGVYVLACVLRVEVEREDDAGEFRVLE
jgi:hypothetical protein